MDQPTAPPRNAKPGVVDRLKRFIETESAGAKLLALASLLALGWANSPLSSSYFSIWDAHLPEALTFGDRIPDLRHLINDGAMTLFFLVVGLEIRRELLIGELNSFRTALLPAVGALGGMLLPSAIYLSLNVGTSTARGWGIPIATDIAFAVALLAAFGSRLPTALKVFLLSLAIVDDIGAIAAIAIFYAEQIRFVWLVAMGALTAALVLWTRTRVLSWRTLIPVGTAMWLAALFAGIHPTIAGVLLAFTISVRDDEGPRIEERLHPWTGLVVVPLFGLANAGISVSIPALGQLPASPVGVGIVAGLVLGKMVGVTLPCWAAVKMGVGRLPSGVSWSQLIGASAAAGIGFTVSLFVTDLAFTDPALVETAKLSVLLASAISAVIAAVILGLGSRRDQQPHPPSNRPLP